VVLEGGLAQQGAFFFGLELVAHGDLLLFWAAGRLWRMPVGAL
jgi:hypothetical protein